MHYPIASRKAIVENRHNVVLNYISLPKLHRGIETHTHKRMLDFGLHHAQFDFATRLHKHFIGFPILQPPPTHFRIHCVCHVAGHAIDWSVLCVERKDRTLARYCSALQLGVYISPTAVQSICYPSALYILHVDTFQLYQILTICQVWLLVEPQKSICFYSFASTSPTLNLLVTFNESMELVNL